MTRCCARTSPLRDALQRALLPAPSRPPQGWGPAVTRQAWGKTRRGVRRLPCPLPRLRCPRQGVLILHVVLRVLAIAHEQRQVVQTQPPGAIPVTQEAHRLRQGVRTEVAMMQCDMRHPLLGVIILVDARTEGGQGRPQRGLERAQARMPCDSHIQDRLQPPGKDPEPGRDHLKGGRRRRERTQDGLDQRHLILFGDMVGHMRKRWDIHALEAEPVLQTGPHGGDLGGMAVVKKRDNPVHTSLLSACSWEAASLASQSASVMAWHTRARPPPTPCAPTGGRWKRGSWACLGGPLPGHAWRDSTHLHTPLSAPVVREYEERRPRAASSGSGGSSIAPFKLGGQTAADPSVGMRPRLRIALWLCSQDSPKPCSRWTSRAAPLRPACVFYTTSCGYGQRDDFSNHFS